MPNFASQCLEEETAGITHPKRVFSDIWKMRSTFHNAAVFLRLKRSLTTGSTIITMIVTNGSSQNCLQTSITNILRLDNIPYSWTPLAKSEIGTIPFYPASLDKLPPDCWKNCGEGTDRVRSSVYWCPRSQQYNSLTATFQGNLLHRRLPATTLKLLAQTPSKVSLFWG